MNVHGGIVQSLEVAGDAIIHGGIITKLVVHGNCTQHGGIVNQRVIMAQKEEPLEPTIIYKDKIVYKEREKVVYRDRLPEECEKELKDLRKLTRYYEGYALKLEEEIVKQGKRIARLNEQLEKALNRERVAVMSRKDAQKELERIMANQWDFYRPTKEEVRKFYRVVLQLLDCEISY